MQVPDKFSYLQIAWKDRPQWWRYLIGILIMVFVNIIGQFLIFIPFSLLADDPSQILSEDGSMDLMGSGIHPAIMLMVLVTPFIFIIFALWITLKLIHQREFSTLFAADKRLDWNRFFYSFGLWIAMMILLEVVAYAIEPSNYVFSLDLKLFIPVVLVSLVFLPLQTSAEEFLFRGYLTQGIGASTRRPWIAILSTSILFAALHLANPEIGKYGYILVVNYLSVGIILGIITLMDERIELALGYHAANNIYSATFVTFSGSVLQTPALFTLKDIDVNLMVWGWFVPAAAFMIILARKYQWKSWYKLFQKVPEPLPTQMEGRNDTNDLYQNE